MINTLQTNVSRTGFMLTIYIMQPKSLFHNINLCNASTAAIMATVRPPANANRDAVNVARSTIPENVKVLLFNAFSAKARMKLGIPSAQ